MKLQTILVTLALMLVFTSGCSSTADTTAITSAGLYLDPEGTQSTEIYDARAIFYCMITLDQPIPEMTLRASWIAVETNRLAPNSVIRIEDITPTSSPVIFKLENAGNFWPTGHYKIYLYVDGKESREIDFEVYHDYFPE